MIISIQVYVLFGKNAEIWQNLQKYFGDLFKILFFVLFETQFVYYILHKQNSELFYNRHFEYNIFSVQTQRLSQDYSYCYFSCRSIILVQSILDKLTIKQHLETKHTVIGLFKYQSDSLFLKPRWFWSKLQCGPDFMPLVKGLIMWD